MSKYRIVKVTDRWYCLEMWKWFPFPMWEYVTSGFTSEECKDKLFKTNKEIVEEFYL